LSSSPPAFTTPEAAAADGGQGARIVYVLERIDIVGNRTREGIIRRFVPLRPGDLLDVDDPEIERIRWRLMGTGWFNDVHLRLTRGSERGRVVLVVEVKERNTLVISRVVAGLSRVVTSTKDKDDELRPYAGIGLTESNLLGLGINLSASAVISEYQRGFELRYGDPMLLGGGFDLIGRVFYNAARDFFGREPQVDVGLGCPAMLVLDPDCVRKRAVVIYDRGGFGVGTGHDITSALRWEADWLGELVDVNAKPRAAATLVGKNGEDYAPIDFHIDDDTSRVSSLHFGLILDRRDDPALPSKGQALRFDARVGTGLIGSTYDFARLEATFRHFQPLPWNHVVSFGLYAGTAFGRTPFFYRFYAADLSDLLPSRALELNLDYRRSLNLLGTSIQEFDKTDLAARLDFEYELPLLRKNGGSIRGIDAYAGAGLFFLAERAALRTPLPGYEGLEQVPVDLTFDLGIQADTAIGVFKIGFSSLIGFLPDLGQENP
jgi:outer membrane protein assembly factor BamA